mmetsp:Transcript_12356/g.20027  ORF Transcript_12356/g.20027 Transcript_12356/m.20027 type:complete len:1091 (-) Transcript_12356:299-3571(-)
MFIRRYEGAQSTEEASGEDGNHDTNLDKGIRRNAFAKFFSRPDTKMWMNTLLVIFGLLGFALYVASTYNYDYQKRLTWEVVLESIITAYFVLELCVSTYLANSKIGYLISIDGIVSILSILPILGVILDSATDTVFLRAFRMFSVLRAIRAMYSTPVVLTKNAVIHVAMNSVIVPILSATLIVTAILYFVYTLSDASFITYGYIIPVIQWHDMWYASTIALLTGGFNDIAPNAAASRSLATLFVLAAIFILPWQVARLVTFLNNKPKYMGSYRAKHRTPHVVICGTSPPETLVAFVEDYFYRGKNYGVSEMVFLVPDDPCTELLVLVQKSAFRGKITYLKGSPMNLGDLQRARVSLCSCVFLLADRAASDPHKEDALIMMRHSAIRAYDPTRPILVEVLLPSTKRHIPGAVCLAEINMRLMAHSASCPGLGTLVTDLLTSHVHKVHMSTSQTRFRRKVKRYFRRLRFWEVTDPLGDSVEVNNRGMTTMAPMGHRRMSLAMDEGWVEDYNYSRSNEVYSVRLGRSFAGMSFRDACLDLYRQKGVLMIGLQVEESRKGVWDVNILLKESDIGYIMATSEASARDVVNYVRRIVHGGEVHSRPRGLVEEESPSTPGPPPPDSPSTPGGNSSMDNSGSPRENHQGHGGRGGRSHRLSLAEFPVMMNAPTGSSKAKSVIDQIMTLGSLYEPASSSSRGGFKGRVSTKASMSKSVTSGGEAKADEGESSSNAPASKTPTDLELRKAISEVLKEDSSASASSAMVNKQLISASGPKVTMSRSMSFSSRASLQLNPGVQAIPITSVPSIMSEHVVVCCASPVLGSQVTCDWLKFFAEGVRIQVGGSLSSKTIVVLQPEAPWPLVQPLTIDNVYFVEGSPLLREDLDRVNVAKARVVLILSSRGHGDNLSGWVWPEFEAEAIDMDAITACSEVELATAHGPVPVPIIVELVFKSNVRFIRPPPPRSLGIHFWPCVASGKAFPSGALDTLLCQAYYNGREVLELIKKLVGDRDDKTTSSIFHVRNPEIYHGKLYQELFSDFIQDGRLLPIGLYRPEGTKGSVVPYVYTNPPPETMLLPKDTIYILRICPPEMKPTSPKRR